MDVIQVCRGYDDAVMCTMPVNIVNWVMLKNIEDSGYILKLNGNASNYAKLHKLFNGSSYQPHEESTLVAQPVDKKKALIQCVETGEVFSKQSEAARAYNIDPAQVSDSIKTGRKRSGYTFKKVEG